MQEPTQARNPFYFLLLIASLVFVITVLAVAIVPALEDRAESAGEPPPPSPFRKALREDGWRWLLYEVGIMIVFGLSSMSLDRWQRLQKERASATMSPAEESPEAAGNKLNQAGDPAKPPAGP